MFADTIRNRLARLVDAPVKDMWYAVKLKTPTCDCSSGIMHNLLDMRQVNELFVGISFDPTSKAEQVPALRPPVSSNDSFRPLFAYE